MKKIILMIATIVATAFTNANAQNYNVTVHIDSNAVHQSNIFLKIDYLASGATIVNQGDSVSIIMYFTDLTAGTPPVSKFVNHNTADTVGSIISIMYGLTAGHLYQIQVEVVLWIGNVNVAMAQSNQLTLTTDCLPFQLSTTGTTTICSGANAMLSASGAQNFFWSTGETTASINVMPLTGITNYSVYGIDANGCQSMPSTIVVTVNQSPTITVGANQTICAGSAATLTASGGNSYSWRNSNGTIISTTSSVSVSPFATSVYFLTGTSASGCQSLPDTVTVNVIPAITVNAGSDQSICLGEVIFLNVTSNTAGVNFNWSQNGVAIPSGTVAPINSTIYTVTAQLGSCVSPADQVQVFVKPIPNTYAGTDKLICEGVNTTLTVSGATTYAWSTGQSTQTININSTDLILGPNIFSVTGTLNGCSKTDTVSITVNPIPTANAGFDQTACPGTPTTFAASGGNSYLWSTGSIASSITVSPSSTTVYWVRATSVAGCQSKKDTVILNVTSVPAAYITPGGPLAFCTGGNVVLNANPGISYQWYRNGNVIPSGTAQSYNAILDGSYTVMVQTSCGNATSSAAIVSVSGFSTVTLNPSGSMNLCQGSFQVLTSTTPGIFIRNFTDTVAMNVLSFNANMSGNYQVIVGASSGCPIASNSVSLTFNPLPSSVVTPNGPTTFCAGNSVLLSTTNIPGYSYLWSNGNTGAGISVNSSGNYSVTVTDANGCNSTSANVAVYVASNPIVSIVPSTTDFCAGNSANLLAIVNNTTGNTFSWNTGGNTSLLNVMHTSTNTVTVTSSYGCVGTATQAVVEHPNPTGTISIIGNSTICAGTSTTIKVVTAGTNTLLWDIGATTPTIHVSDPGSYDVTITSPDGCQTTKTSPVVSQNDTPSVVVNSQGSSTLVALATGGAPSYNYVWHVGGSTFISQSVSFSATATYSVIVTDQNGCSTSFSSILYIGIHEITMDELINLKPIQMFNTVGQMISINELVTGIYFVTYDELNPSGRKVGVKTEKVLFVRQ